MMALLVDSMIERKWISLARSSFRVELKLAASSLISGGPPSSKSASGPGSRRCFCILLTGLDMVREIAQATRKEKAAIKREMPPYWKKAEVMGLITSSSLLPAPATHPVKEIGGA